MKLSAKERFLDICHFKRPGDLYLFPDIGCGYGDQTLKNWIEQGAPRGISNLDFQNAYFHYEPMRPLEEIISGAFYIGACRLAAPRPPSDLGNGITIAPAPRQALVPDYEQRLIAEDERSVTYVNNRGQTVKHLRDSLKMGWGMPEFLDWPVKDSATWKELKTRLDPFAPGRWPEDWANYAREINKIGEMIPISMNVGSFYGFLREWVGSERVLYMFYDNPGLIEEIMEQILYLETEVIKWVLKDIKVDMATYWEDMCYKAGPLISPAMVRKFMVPRYKKITELLHSYGVDVIFVDCDGNLEKMVPIWLECGINYIWPFEVAAGNDVVAMRKKYPKDLIIGGGIDKRELIRGKDAIKEEVMAKVPFLLEQGGYFPTVDHIVPGDVNFENYCYYLNLVREVAGLDKLKFV